jgi:hypothetical protein
MAKATLTLKSGATVTIEGSASDVHKLLQLHDQDTSSSGIPKSRDKRGKRAADSTNMSVDAVTEIVNLIKSCEDAELIEKQILDKSNVMNRCLLPLYMIHQELNGALGLTTGQISAITKELGVLVLQPNVAHTLANSASKFVMASHTRKRGVASDYRINRRGVQYLEAVISAS